MIPTEYPPNDNIRTYKHNNDEQHELQHDEERNEQRHDELNQQQILIQITHDINCL